MPLYTVPAKPFPRSRFRVPLLDYTTAAGTTTGAFPPGYRLIGIRLRFSLIFPVSMSMVTPFMAFPITSTPPPALPLSLPTHPRLPIVASAPVTL